MLKVLTDPSPAARERFLRTARLQQQLQLAETQRGHIQSNLQQLDSRRSRLMLERDNLPQTDAVEMAVEAWVSASESDDNERQIYRVSNNVQR